MKPLSFPTKNEGGDGGSWVKTSQGLLVEQSLNFQNDTVGVHVPFSEVILLFKKRSSIFILGSSSR